MVREGERTLACPPPLLFTAYERRARFAGKTGITLPEPVPVDSLQASRVFILALQLFSHIRSDPFVIALGVDLATDEGRCPATHVRDAAETEFRVLMHRADRVSVNITISWEIEGGVMQVSAASGTSVARFRVCSSMPSPVSATRSQASLWSRELDTNARCLPSAEN